MRLNEFLPARALASFWRRCNAVPLQDVAHRLVRNRIAQIGERTDDPILPPTAVLLGHADNQRLDLRADSRPSRVGSMAGSVELAGDQAAVPAENRLGLGDTGYIGEEVAAEAFTDFS